MRAYEEVAEFIARRGPREVADFRPSPEVRQRVVELLRSEKTTGLTVPENLAFACFHCNRHKGTDKCVEWVAAKSAPIRRILKVPLKDADAHRP